MTGVTDGGVIPPYIHHMSKVLDNIKADPRVASVSDERSTGDGVWVYLKPGYVSDSTDTGTIHEDNWTKAYRVLKEVKK